MKFSPIIILLAIFMALPADLQAQVNMVDQQTKGARYSRHLILPFLGYQSMNGEKTSFGYFTSFTFQHPDTTFTFQDDIPGERDVRAPSFGLTYRLRLSHQLNLDASFAVIHDGITQQYDAKVTTYGYTVLYPLYLRRSNTMITTFGAGYNVPLPKQLQFLGINVWGSAGFAWRNIEVTNNNDIDITTSHTTANRMMVGRIGAEAMLWNGNMMMLMGSVFYGQFIPTDSDIDPFGGIGWSLALFPMWIDQ